MQTILNILIATGFALGVGWLGDALTGQNLLALRLGSSVPTWWGLAGSALWTIVFGAWLYDRRKTFLPVRYISVKRDCTPHRILIACVSNHKAEVKQVNGHVHLIFETGYDVELQGDIQQDKENPQLSECRWSWQQLLRGIAPHARDLQSLYLIGSRGEDGSARQLDQCKLILSQYFSDHVAIHAISCGIDFEDVEEVCQTLELAVGRARRSGGSDADIILDATGGQKTTSIAAAMATLRHPEIEFQYVQTVGARVLSYNVVTASIGSVD